MNCKICDKLFTGIESKNQHENSLKHKKKVLLHLQSQSNAAQNYNLSGFSQAPSESLSAQNVNDFPCDICSKIFHSLSDIMEHCNSEEHAKRILNKKSELEMETLVCNSTIKDFSNRTDPLDSISNLKKDSGLLNMSGSTNLFYTRCELCDKEFSGPRNYEEHIVSNGHRKKIALSSSASQYKNQKIIANDISSSNVSFETLSNTLNFPKQEDLNPTGMIHAESSSVKVTSDSSSNTLLNNLICDICNMTFSGPVPHNQHMQSMSHKKRIERKQLLTQMNGFKQNRHSESVVDSKPNGVSFSNPWHCETCNKICSGPEPYQQHMIGVKHMKNVAKAGAEHKPKDMQNIISNMESLVDSKPNGVSFSNPWYCETCNKICSGPEPFREHMNSANHKKNVAKAGAENKQEEIRNIMTKSSEEVDIFSSQKSATVDFNTIEDNNASWISIPSGVSDSFLDEVSTSCAVDIANLNMTFFKVGEEIDFDANKKRGIDIEVDVDSIEDEEDEEATYEDMPSP